MEIKHILVAVAMMLTVSASAQKRSAKKELDYEPVTREFLYSVSPENPYRLNNPTIVTLSNNPSTLPDFGSKHMFLFYVDPESYIKESANRDLEKELKADGKLGWEGKTYSPEIQGYAVLNLADTRIPSGLIRSVVKMVLGKDVPSRNFADNDHSLKHAWKLPDVNNKFVLMFITRDGDLVFYRESPMTDEEKELMYNTIQMYR